MKRKVLLALFTIIFITIGSVCFAGSSEMFYMGSNFSIKSETNETWETLYPTANTGSAAFINEILIDGDDCFIEILTTTHYSSFITKYKVKEGDVLRFYTEKEISSRNYLIEYRYLRVAAFYKNAIWFEVVDEKEFYKQYK